MLAGQTSLLLTLNFDDEFIQCVVDGIFSRLPDPLVPDRPGVIDDVERGRGWGIPLLVDDVFVVERPPGDVVLDHDLLEFARIVNPGIDAEHCERLVFQFRNERPLV